MIVLFGVGTNDRLTKLNLKNKHTTDTLTLELTKLQLFSEDVYWKSLERKKDSAVILGNGITLEKYSFDGVRKWSNVPESLVLNYNNNSPTFYFRGITQQRSKKVTYSYMLDGYDKDWSAFSNQDFAPYGNLPHGEYTFKVRCIDGFGTPSKIVKYAFKILTPWWLTVWAVILYVLFSILVVYLIVQWRTSTLKKRQKQLELEIDNATEEIVAQRDAIEEQKNEIEEAHQEIKDSIAYAKRIQNAILPSDELVKSTLPNSFILYQPKDVVAGDFYWIENLTNGVLFAAADCTGHGVPGAMVSVVCNNALNRSVREYNLSDPGKILDKTREIVLEELSKNNEDVKDGMDIALCKLHGNTLYYSGANNPLWIVRNDEVLETKANKQPIGKFDNHTNFDTHSIQLERGDSVYIFSDGYVDQFGGEKDKKFGSRRLKQLLIEINSESMQTQKEILSVTLSKWMDVQGYEQIDDVCIVGIRI